MFLTRKLVLMNSVLLAGISVIALHVSGWAQTSQGARQPTTSISLLSSNREKDGLVGSVRRVRTEQPN